ncbi:MAG: substrate-binding domain-containing protein [Lachnospiraceae bacterium]|nr:substrate-binding domain-containing protein [Lachnospiraceae bacterium]
MIKVGIINNPPSESGYREANDRDMKSVFTEENGYDAAFSYSLKNDEQIRAAEKFLADGVNYLLISPAEPTGWDSFLKKAKEAGVKVILFDREIYADPSLYETCIKSDMQIEGEKAVEWLRNKKLPEYNVIHIQGAMGSEAQIGRTAALDKQFASGKMNKVLQQTATWDEAEAKNIVRSVIESGRPFNVIYAENDGMAKGAVAALDEYGITHGVSGDVIIISFDCNKWALRELYAGNWNYDGQCSPFQADYAEEAIRRLEMGDNLPDTMILEEKGFDAEFLTQDDIAYYGLGE